MGQECFDFLFTHGFRVLLAVKQDEPSNPGDLGKLRAVRIMLQPQFASHHVDQLGFL
jgi:hypothetical protein